MKLNSLADLHKVLDASHQSATSTPKEHDGKGRTVRIFLDTKGRKGKTVTIIAGLQHNPATMEDIARILKEHCGAGGTVKDRNIELQGDQRTRASNKLRELKYVVK